MEDNTPATRQDIALLKEDVQQIQANLKQDIDRAVETIRDVETHLLAEFHRYA